jgi:hypothetical protein
MDTRRFLTQMLDSEISMVEQLKQLETNLSMGFLCKYDAIRTRNTSPYSF